MRLGTRLWALVTVIVIAGLVAGGWFLGASPLLQTQAQSETARLAAVTQNSSIETTIAKLAMAKDSIELLQARALELETTIPRDVESAAFITALNSLGQESGVVVSSITIGDGVPYSPPSKSDAKSDSGSKSDAGSKADSGSAGGTGAPRPLTDQRITEDNFVLIPVTIEVVGEWGSVMSFVHGVQTGPRLVLVTKLDTTASGTSFATSISGAMYVLKRKDAPQTGTSADADTDGEVAAAG